MRAGFLASDADIQEDKVKMKEKLCCLTKFFVSKEKKIKIRGATLSRNSLSLLQELVHFDPIIH